MIWAERSAGMSLALSDGATPRPLTGTGAPYVDGPFVDDTAVAVDPVDPARRYFVPHYTLAGRADDPTRFDLRMAPRPGGWTLTLTLDAGRAPGVPEDTLPIDHELAVALVYELATENGGSAVVRRPLDVQRTPEGAACSLVVDDVAERDEIFHALTTADAAVRVVAERTVSVAVLASGPVPPPQPRLGPTDLLALAPSASWKGLQLVDDVGNGRDAVDLPFPGGSGDPSGFAILSDAVTVEDGTWRRALRTHPKWVERGCIKGWFPAVVLPPQALLTFEVGFVSGATGTDGVEFHVFAHYTGFDGRARMDQVHRAHKAYTGALDPYAYDLSHLGGLAVGFELRVDAGPSSGRDWAVWTGVEVHDTTPEPEPPAPVYLHVRTALAQDDVLPVPYLDRGLHAYAFAGLTPGSDDMPRMHAHTVTVNGTPHVFYRKGTGSLFYVLPDAYRLGRRSEAPFTPRMMVRFVADAGGMTSLRAEVSSVFEPVDDPGRLTAAAELLAAQVTDLDPDRPVTFDWLRTTADRLDVTLVLPTPGGTVGRVSRPGALSSVDGDVVDVSVFDLDGFQTVFDALMGRPGSLVLTGEVRVRIGDDLDHVVPVEARMTHLAGPLFQHAVASEGAGRSRVRLRNATESTVRVPRLPLRPVTATSAATPAAPPVTDVAVDGVPVTLPVDVAPGAELTAVVGADAGGVEIDDGAPDLVVLPDRDAVWAAVVDDRVPVPVRQTVTVEVLASLFDAHADLQRIVVDLEGAAGVRFARGDAQLVQSVDVPVSLRELVVRPDVTRLPGSVPVGAYRYRVQAVRTDGSVRTSPWTTATGTFLFPDLTSVLDPVVP